MTIKEMDSSTRKIIYLAHLITQDIKREDLNDKLAVAVAEWNTLHEAERCNNLIRALWGRGK